MDIGLGISAQRSSIAATKEAIAHARRSTEETQFDLILVMSCLNTVSAATPTIIAAAIPNTPILGASAPLILTPYGILRHGLAVMLIRFSPETTCTFGSVKHTDQKSGVAVGEDLGAQLLPKQMRNLRRNLSLILSDGSIKEGNLFVQGVQAQMGKSFPWVGAYTSSILHNIESPLYYDQELLYNSCIGVLLGGKVNFGLGIKHGWNPIGKPHVVTSSYGNMVESIDDKPAIQLYEDYLGWNSSRIREDLKQISTLYPIGIYLEEEKEYLLRNIVSVETNGTVWFQGDVPHHSNIHLMIGTKESCLQATQDAIIEAKSILGGHTKFGMKRFALVFNSISRYHLLKRDFDREIATLQGNLGDDMPFLGMCTFTELAPLKATQFLGQVHFHNQSVATLILEN